MKHFYYKITCYIIILSLAVLSLSCEKDSDIYIPDTDRTVLIYMLAKNNLDIYARQNINDMTTAVSHGSLNGGNLVIYLTDNGTSPQLIQILRDINGKAVKKTLKTYTNTKSATKECLASVIADMKKLLPSQDYGLILWGHATGWVPNASQLAMAPPVRHTVNGISSRSVGLKSNDEKENDYMEITDVADAIPDKTFSFIISDMCLMGQVETTYQLRNKADYIIGSATEVIAYGLPYQKVIPLLFKTNADLTGVCDANYDYYMNMDIPKARAVTTALIHTRYLEELAEISRKILSAQTGKIPSLNLENMQHFDKSAPYIFYDLQEFFEKLADPEEIEKFNTCLRNTILRQRYSRMYNFYPMVIERHCGLSVYIPGTGDTSLEKFYTTLDWYKHTYPAEYLKIY